jgi:maleamate amidohydrolase
MSFPWDGVIPDADIASFAGGHGTIERPLRVGERPALLIVDMTYNFVDSRYPTGWSPTGEPAVAANAQLLRHARMSGTPVIFSKMFEDPEHEATAGEGGRWKPSQSAAADPTLPPGDVIVPDLDPQRGELVLAKGFKPSAFFGTTLASWLIYEHVDTLIITGMSTSGCVRATALDAFQYNFHVVVPHEACADRSQISHQVTLFDLHMKYADVAPVRQVCDYLDGLG